MPTFATIQVRILQKSGYNCLKRTQKEAFGTNWIRLINLSLPNQIYFFGWQYLNILTTFPNKKIHFYCHKSNLENKKIAIKIFFWHFQYFKVSEEDEQISPIYAKMKFTFQMSLKLTGANLFPIKTQRWLLRFFHEKDLILRHHGNRQMDRTISLSHFRTLSIKN